jgi:molecular chaperone GrpE (heat shock protein)
MWIVWTLLALLAGGGLGAWLGRRGPLNELAERTRRAEKDLQEQRSRAEESLRAMQAKAAKDLEDARSRWQAETAAATAAQRAESEKLSRHLTEAYDELDRLRVRAAGKQPPDTGQGFAATMPLGDL